MTILYSEDVRDIFGLKHFHAAAHWRNWPLMPPRWPACR